jgi:branched-chain amino acid transport system substrate-binding protein
MTASPILAADVIKVGAVQPITGVFSFAGVQINAGLQDALTMANEEGGIDGKRIEYIMEDGKYNLNVAKAAFKRIMTAHKPMIMYGESTALGKAMTDDIKNKYKILYSSTSFSSVLAQGAMNPYAFVPGPTYGDQFGILMKYIARKSPKAKVAFFYSDTEFGKDPIKYGRIMCRDFRLHLVAEETSKPGAKDVSAQIRKLKEKNPDYIIFHGYVLSPVPEVIKKCRELGMHSTFMGTFWGTTKMLLDKLGPLAEGYLGVNPYNFWWMEDVPMIQKIKQFNANHHPEVTFRPNSYMQGFVTGMIFVECLKRADRAGQLNSDGLVKALKSLKGFETGGLTAPLTIKNNRFPVARIWQASVEKGIFEPAPLPKGLEHWIRIGY